MTKRAADGSSGDTSNFKGSQKPTVFVRPFAPHLDAKVTDAILARGAEKPWRKRGVPRGAITAAEFFRTTYAEWLDQGIEITGRLLRRTDRGLYQQLYNEKGKSFFAKDAEET